MAARKKLFATTIAGIVALVLGATALRFGTRDAPERSRPTAPVGDGLVAERSGAERPVDATPVPARFAATQAHPDPAGSPSPGPRAVARAQPLLRPPLPDEGPDAEAWRRSQVAFRPRELGRMGASVKTALDAARRNMEFCFRRAAAAGHGDAGTPMQPAILLLYLEAREGALDVIDTRTDYLGDATVDLVECCREVLRGLEIPAFDAVPGQRYRLKYPLE